MAAVISTHPPLANTVPRAYGENGPSNSVTRGCSGGVLQDLGSCGRECADIDAVSLPANTLVGGCGAWMSIYHGSACHLACTSGYDGNPRLSCDDGTLTVLGSCVENVCSAATVSSDPGGTEFFPAATVGQTRTVWRMARTVLSCAKTTAVTYGSEYGSSCGGAPGTFCPGETVTRTCNSDGTVTDDVDCSDPYSDGALTSETGVLRPQISQAVTITAWTPVIRNGWRNRNQYGIPIPMVHGNKLVLRAMVPVLIQMAPSEIMLTPVTTAWAPGTLEWTA